MTALPRCSNHAEPPRARPVATVRFGARFYCGPCADFLRDETGTIAPVLTVRKARLVSEATSKQCIGRRHRAHGGHQCLRPAMFGSDVCVFHARRWAS